MEQLLYELKRRAKIIRKAGVAGESFGFLCKQDNLKCRCLILIWDLFLTVNEDEEKADSYKRKLTTNILNVVAALAFQSVRNTG